MQIPCLDRGPRHVPTEVFTVSNQHTSSESSRLPFSWVRQGFDNGSRGRQPSCRTDAWSASALAIMRNTRPGRLRHSFAGAELVFGNYPIGRSYIVPSERSSDARTPATRVIDSLESAPPEQLNDGERQPAGSNWRRMGRLSSAFVTPRAPPRLSIQTIGVVQLSEHFCHG